MPVVESPPPEYPVVAHTREMVQAYVRLDYAEYERHRDILLAYIANVDRMVALGVD
jgi:hypothetical protein